MKQSLFGSLHVPCEHSMNFNDTLEFTPAIGSIQKLDRSFHILLSAYLRESRTFELYDAIFNAIGRDAVLLPFELSTQDAVSRLPELIGVLRSNTCFRSILVSDPYKQAFSRLVDEVTPQACRCGGINMIYKRGQTVTGDNRDGEAFLTGASSAHAFDFRNKRMLFFGCGGVSSAVAVTVSRNLHTVGLIDSHRERMTELAAALRELNPTMRIITFDTSSSRNFLEFDVLYNGTGLGKGARLDHTMSASPLRADDVLPHTGAAFDANYTPEKTVFLEQLEQAGLKTYNGLCHMLSSTAIHLSLVEDSSLTYRTVESIYRGLFTKR